MPYAHPPERAELIKGLHSLADYLETSHDVPAPSHVDVYTFPPDGDCAEMHAKVDAIAELLGTQAYEAAEGRHYVATRSFGRVQYRAVAICKQSCHADDDGQEVDG